jgi:hypothetical protein
MLGKTAGGLFWMYRYLERSENTARLIEAGFRIALTRLDGADDEWRSVLQTAAVEQGYAERHGEVRQGKAIDWTCCATRTTPPRCATSAARQNARLVRTALTREVWEAVNDTYMMLKEALARKVRERDLPEALATIRSAHRRWCAARPWHDAAQRHLRFLPPRHLPGTRRQHRAHSRREILRAPALDQPRSGPPSTMCNGRRSCAPSPGNGPIAG